MRRAALAAAALGAVLVAAPPGPAQEGGAALPPSIQAALLKKVFLFDEALARRDVISVLVVHAGDGAAGEEAAREVAAAFRALDLAAETAGAAEAAERLPRTAVVYFGPGGDADELRGACTRLRCLTVAGTPALAEAGRVAVAVGLSSAGTPEIVVHRGRLAEEGHELPARVLQLARVVS
jgi:hypothetical protein